MYWMPLLENTYVVSCDSPETGFTSLSTEKLRACIGDGAEQTGDYCYAWKIEGETNQLEPMMEAVVTASTVVAALDSRGAEWENEKEK